MAGRVPLNPTRRAPGQEITIRTLEQRPYPALAAYDVVYDIDEEMQHS